ncbi:MAG TPA: hypothetical protein VFX07_09985 [Candidatus Udaeobacter sp.]|jgi:hypothetical protein|nr:hypothetical protein [Candidatus Udaeobacter sp.]
MSDTEGKTASVTARETGLTSFHGHEWTPMIFESDVHVPFFVILSEVENRAAGEDARRTARPKAERVGSERIKSLEIFGRL